MRNFKLCIIVHCGQNVQVPRDECNYSHPGMIITVAAAIATIRDIEIDVVLTKCRENTFLMYGV